MRRLFERGVDASVYGAWKNTACSWIHGIHFKHEIHGINFKYGTSKFRVRTTLGFTRKPRRVRERHFLLESCAKSLFMQCRQVTFNVAALSFASSRLHFSVLKTCRYSHPSATFDLYKTSCVCLSVSFCLPSLVCSWRSFSGWHWVALFNTYDPSPRSSDRRSSWSMSRSCSDDVWLRNVYTNLRRYRRYETIHDILNHDIRILNHDRIITCV